MKICGSWERDYVVPSSSGRGTYTVSLTGPQGANTCTCPAFEFSRKGPTCKHLESVLAKQCLWREDLGPEVATDNTTCPRCGNVTCESGERFEEDMVF